MKYCINSEKNEQYKYLFRCESEHLNALCQLMKSQSQEELYNRLFPCQVQNGLHAAPDRNAFIRMQYIHGINLEEYLQKQYRPDRPEPRILIPPDKLSHLFEQLYVAFTWLNRAGILAFDLSPWNIIITNEATFDIRLVDFTHSCYMDTSGHIPDGPRKRMDNCIWPNLPVPLLVWNHYVLLFTRMFFSGNEQYNRGFQSSKSSVQNFFIENFQNTADLVLSFDQAMVNRYIAQAKELMSSGACDNLTYLTNWHHQLQNTLRLLALRFQ